MKITVVSLFPGMFKGFLEDSIIKRAQDAHKVNIAFVNPRDFTHDPHKTVDDRPFGGGAGMIMMVEPLQKAIQAAKESGGYVIGTSARGKKLTQNLTRELAQKEHLIIVAGHYEGYDERVRPAFDIEVSLGDFILTGGELAAACIIDAVVRVQKGVLKKDAATQEESFFEVPLDELMRAVGSDELLTTLHNKGTHMVTLLEYPQYTRPQEIAGMRVPEVLLSGDPKKFVYGSCNRHLP
ncbi:MAG: tRNA (guanine-N(1)-)-methyltransferase [Microgenomates bacterium OLB23]|nr:MAG: tRNA (guanine-N(1)-)-methyltransferase [Microgenomates bacterium OLB23]